MDKKHTILNKALLGLERANLLNSNLQEEVSSLVDSMEDVDSVSPVLFAKAVVNLVETGEPLVMESILVSMTAFAPKAVARSSGENVIEDVYIESDAEKLARLLDIAENTEEFVEDFDVTDLTENGLRSIGALDSFETSLDAEEVALGSSRPTVYIEGSDIILSPFGEDHGIFRVDNNTFMDLDTGEYFKVYWK